MVLSQLRQRCRIHREKIYLKLKRQNKKVEGTIQLPKGTTGEFIWNKSKVQLREGTQTVNM